MKKLIPTTMIPSSLYVERAADRQLYQTIKEMGRPPYVLVARQMGKTNLLIHAKRYLEKDGDIFIYIDLSNRYNDLIGYYRHIVDTILDSCENHICAEEVSKIRLKGLEDHREYEDSLRVVLRSISGKLVVILDEIDAMGSTGFSDRFFSQVRSTYFSPRVNYPEMNRLTYVLSGVAEPSDLIRDKSVSPFNIGEKIYLDDFTRVEFADFLSKAGLHLSGDTFESVYLWCGGSPRITWDVCSRLEDLSLSGKNPLPADVDDVVTQLYLGGAPKAPIDHIRTLVESDSEVRSGVIGLKFGADLNEKLKNRLYLAGIIASDYNSTPPRIKNKVIEAALSDRWLSELDSVSSQYISKARAASREKNYAVAVEAFDAYIVAAGEDALDATDAYMFAHALQKIPDYDRAAEFCRIANEKSDSLRLTAQIRNLEGMLALAQNDWEEAIEASELADNCDYPDLKSQAKLIMSSALLAIDPLKNHDLIVDLCQSVFDLSVSDDGFIDSAAKNRAMWARYNIVSALRASGDIKGARDIIEKTVGDCDPRLSVRFFLELFDIAEANEHQLIVERLVNHIIMYGVVPFDGAYTFDFTEKDFLNVLVLARFYGREGDFNRTLEYAYKVAYRGGRSRVQIVENLIERAHEFPEITSVYALLPDLIDAAKLENHPEVKIREYMMLWMAGRAAAIKMDVIDEFIDRIFNSDKVDKLDDLEMIAMCNIVTRLVTDGAIQKAYDLVTKIRRTGCLHKNAHGSILYESYIMGFYKQVGLIDEAKNLANSLLDMIQNEDRENSATILTRAAIDGHKVAAQKILRTIVDPFSSYGRNTWVTVQFNNGALKTVKFKFVESDLREGLCVLVTE